ncbi:MAG TPA: hypothetical protein VN622_18435 [Clostridia bacterium]|nr:hypothetical protein [Clostridia bacterium]
MAETFSFTARGIAGNPHRVTFRIDECNLTGACSCADGTTGELCEHKLRILTGDPSQIVSGNESQVHDLLDYLPECDVWPHLERLISSKRQLEQAAEQYTEAKDALEHAMND